MQGTSPKHVALWAVSRGFRLPQIPVDRVNELCYLKGLLALLEVDCVLDVGANRGQFATDLRGIGYTGQILSFEPVEAEFRGLSARFQGDHGWSGHHLALGAENTTITIKVPQDTVYTSILEAARAWKNYHTETICVRRLDGLLPELVPDHNSRRIFLKMDTQGYDIEVFEGAQGVLDSIVGLQSELSVVPLYKEMPHYIEALRVYEAAGFDLYNLSVVGRQPDGALVEMNCFMRRRMEEGSA